MKIRKYFFAIITVCLLFLGIIVYAGAETTLTVDEIMDKIEEASPEFSTQKAISKKHLFHRAAQLRSLLLTIKRAPTYVFLSGSVPFIYAAASPSPPLGYSIFQVTFVCSRIVI